LCAIQRVFTRVEKYLKHIRFRRRKEEEHEEARKRQGVRNVSHFSNEIGYFMKQHNKHIHKCMERVNEEIKILQVTHF
jgi:DNA topoisomerase VI subunit B